MPSSLHDSPSRECMRVEEWKAPLEMELSEAEIILVKEDNRRRVKRLVGCVGVSITILAFLMVALSLALGSSIDRLVDEAWKEKHGTSPDFIRKGINLTRR